MLSNSIALIAVAAMLGVEAFKTRDRLPRLVLTALAVAFALSGVLLDKLAVAAPKLVAFVSSIFAEPSSWFVLLVALFFVVRPLWQKRGGDAPFRTEASVLRFGEAVADTVTKETDAKIGQLKGHLERRLEGAEARLKKTDAAFDTLRTDHDSFTANFEPAIEQLFARCVMRSRRHRRTQSGNSPYSSRKWRLG
jgi:hypothetical protein